MTQRAIYHNVPEPSEAELGYMAGFFDGEGSVVATVNSYGSVVISATVTQKSDAPLLFYCKFFPHGRLGISKKNTGEYWQYTIKGKAAGEMLEKLLPCLLVKKEQALLAIQFCKLMPGQGSRKHDRQPLLDVANQIRDLNAGSRPRLV